jgi:pyruvate formate lyase activating enzyme
MISLTRKSDNKLECILCPHYCKISTGKTGICGVRKNTGEKIDLTTYGVLSGYALDPVEKKPLYHFFPGHNILSIGSFGCNMRCDFCQNYHISQRVPDELTNGKRISEIIGDALSAEKNIGIAFTYNEPIISFEYMRDVAQLAKTKGLSTVMVSNGYVNEAPLKEILEFIDAFNIDLKAFNNSFYKKLTGADIEPVKNSLKQISRSGRHLEVTTLVIPQLNDDEKEMKLQTRWIANELGRFIPFHLSGYFPTYKRNTPPTSEESLKRLFDIASENLDYVYMGNTNSVYGQNTSCPSCGTEVTIRLGYKTILKNLDKNGKCTSCGNPVYKFITFS